MKEIHPVGVINGTNAYIDPEEEKRQHEEGDSEEETGEETDSSGKSCEPK